MQEKGKFYFENLSKYRKVLMGVQIILIIIFHFTEDCKIYDVRFSGIINLFYRYIRSSGVDMFLLLSGLGLYFSWKKKPEPKAFYKKRYMRILIPYFIVAVPAWIWLDIFWMDKGWGAFFKDISFISFFFEETRNTTKSTIWQHKLYIKKFSRLLIKTKPTEIKNKSVFIKSLIEMHVLHRYNLLPDKV